MNPSKSTNMLLLQLLCVVLLTGVSTCLGVNAVSYDYTASVECLAEPHKPQYGGGIIRNQPHGNMSHKVYLHKNKIYTFSAWVKVSEESVHVKAMYKTRNGVKFAGDVIAQPNCWSMIKGGLSTNSSGPVEIYFESKNSSMAIQVASVSLQPFTHQEWRSHQHQTIDKMRKRNVRIKVADGNGNAIPNATISIQLKKMGFPVGCSSTKYILNNREFQNWLTSRFTVTTFGDEMKWYSTEGRGQNSEDYTVADNMVQFFKQHNIKIRGHNVFWEDPRYQPYWVPKLSPTQLAGAAKNRQQSVMSRYAGQVIHWDVVNENLHFKFFEDRLGRGFSAEAYTRAHEIDKTATMFMNDYNTLEYVEDGMSSPAKYLQKLKEIRDAPGNKDRMGIGLESHFGGRDPNIGYVRASLDTLGATGLPVWISELDVESCPQQAKYLEMIMREVYSHPKVQGLVLWGGMGENKQCYKMCLTDQNFKNLPTGDVVDKLLKEWGLGSGFSGIANDDGFVEASLFGGDYEVKVVGGPNVESASVARSFKVVSSGLDGAYQEETLFV